MWSTGILEEALHLAGMEIHRQDAVRTGGFEHVGDEASGDRLARSGLLVLPRVEVPGDHGGDPLRRGEARSVDHDQELDEVAVDGLARRLDDEHVRAANRLLVAAVGLAVRERLELDLDRARCRAARRFVARARDSSGPRRASAASAARALSRARPRAPGCGVTVSSPGSACSIVPVSTALLLERPAFLVTCRARAIASAPGGTSSVITEPAAVHAPSPTSTGATNTLSTPILTLRPTVVFRFGRPASCSRLAVIVPAAMFGPIADLCVSDVREVWNLRPLSDRGVLDLDERACLRFGLEHGAGAKVTERADQGTLTDGGVADHRVRADLRSRADPAGAADDRERVDHGVGLDLDLGVDPGGLRIDDRDAGQPCARR